MAKTCPTAVSSLKEQCLAAVVYYSHFKLLEVGKTDLPEQLRRSIQTAPEQPQECCLIFYTAVWKDHYKCSKRIALLHGVDAYLKSLMNQSDVGPVPQLFFEPKTVVKYLLNENFSFSSNALVWAAAESHYEIVAWFLRWGCRPTAAVFDVILSYRDSFGHPVDYISTSPLDYCCRMADETLEPHIALNRQCMRKSNANCLEAVLLFEPPTEAMAMSAIESDNLQCLVVLKRRSCPFPADAVKVAVACDSLDCLDYLLCQYSVDNSVLGLAIQHKSVRCAKLLFHKGYCCDLALYYCVKFQCFELLKFFTRQGYLIGGIEILKDDCRFLKTAFENNYLQLPGFSLEKVENFFASEQFEQYKINQHLAFRGVQENIDIVALLK